MARPNLPDEARGWQALISPSAPWLYLVYLGFFFTGWFYRQPGLAELALSFAALAAFIATYIVAMRRRDWTVVPAVLFSIALGAAFLTVNPGGGVFLVFAGTMLARAENRIVKLGGLALLPVAIVSIGIIYGYPAFFILIALGVTVMAVLGSAYGTWRDRRDAVLEERRAQAETRAAEAERQRIARDLHDLLGQSLTLITLKAELAGRTLDSDPALARGELDEIAAVSRKALTEMRAAVTGLRRLSLGAAMSQARTLLADAGLAVECNEDRVTLSPECEDALVLALREGTTNILRHARASSVSLNLAGQDGHAVLTLIDDGAGGADAEGGGLSGVAQRLAACGGSLALSAGPEGRGTILTAMVPAGEG